MAGNNAVTFHCWRADDPRIKLPDMKRKFSSVRLAAMLGATVLTFVSTAGAGIHARFQDFDAMSNVRTNSVANNMNTGARANRHGADDPANHDINDDRGGANQPGDDQGRHRGRHRGPGR